MLQPAHPSGLISAAELANYAPSNAAGSSGSSSPCVQQQHPAHLAVHHAHSALAMPMDLHLSQGYPFYAHRKGGLEDFVTSQGAGLHSGILEMRKEKSRDAARSRRGKENYEFYELAKMLPLPAAITSQLDKASIIRLTISYLRLKDFSSNGDPPWTKETASKALKGGSRSRSSAALGSSSTLELFDQHQGTHILQSLDGFAFSLGSDGRFLYISETVSIYLGLSQVEMTGSSVFDYVHTADHAELAEQLGLTLASSGQPSAQGSASGQGMNQHHLHSPPSPASATGSVDDGNSSMNPDVTSLMSLESNAAYKGLDRCFCIRMKSTLTKRGCHFKSSGYRVVMVLCRLRPQSQFSASKSNPQQQQLQSSGSMPLLGMIALAIALPPPTVHEVRLEPDMFVTRLSFDFRIVHCEPRVSDLLDFVAEDLTGRSLYTLCHAEDIRLLRKAHTDLMHKGQVMTPYYRVMNRHGGFTWLQSCATVVCNSKNGDEQSIVCVNYVLSRTEMGSLILDQCQLESAPPMPIKTSGFKTDLSSQREFPVSPEDASSESDPRSANQGGASDSSALENRPSPELDVEESGAPSSQLAPPPPPEESGSGLRASRHSRNTNRPGKRKYQDTVSTSASSEMNGMVSLEDVGAAPSSNGVSAEAASAADESSIGHSDDAEADAARWKRLYGGSGMDHETLQDRDMDASSMGGSTTDFSTDALLSKPRSTIQWIGTPTSSSSAAAALSATSLMHQIFASRESVIRANVHANRTPGGIFNGAGGDNLPTPPGSGGPGDYASAVHDSVFTSSYSASTGFRPEYLPAMTPPSSVSPRDATEPSLRYPYTLADSSYVSPAQPLPLKPPPHVYGVHGIDHSASAQYSAQSTIPLTDAGQFYPHGASGFHLYHPQISKSAASNNSAASWYPN